MALLPHERFDLIDFHLYWFGTVRLATLARRLNRKDPESIADWMDKYAIEQASLRGAVAGRFFAPGLRSQGWYTAPADFIPRNAAFDPPETHDPDELLAWLARERGMLTPVPPGWKRPASAQRISEAGRTPDFGEILALDAPPELERVSVSAPILRAILRGLLPDPFEPQRPWLPRECAISYLGPDRLTARPMTIVPIAITHDTFRWAVRAVGPEGPRDFALHRITSFEIVDDALTQPTDADWFGPEVTVRLKPREGLLKAERIVAQYKMKGGILSVPMRRAFVVYFLKRLQLETDLIDVPGAAANSVFNIPGRKAEQQPLAIANPDEVRSWIPDGMRIPPRMM